MTASLAAADRPDASAPVNRSLAQALTLDAGAATLDRSWWSWAGPHGGLVAGLCLRAATPLLGEGRIPRSLSVLFLEPPPEGRLDLRASLVREGGSSAVVAVQAGAAGELARATVVGGRSRGTSSLDTVIPPVVPGPDDCEVLALPVDFVPFSQHLEVRPATAGRPLAGGDHAELVAWVRVAGDPVLDAAALAVLVDALPPALYGATSSPVAVPTLELTVSFTEATSAPASSGWVLLRIATRTAAGGWCVDDSEVWDRDGRLLAQARQTRRVLGEWA